MDRFVRDLTCILLLALCIQSCTEPEQIENQIIEHFSGDTTTIQINDDIESYITGKYVMVSFEKQTYSIPYSQLAVDTAYADADWIIISQYSTYVTVTLEENYTPEFRNCHAYYRIKGSEKYDTLVVSQGPKDTFFISGATLGRVLNNNKQDVYFDVFSNVEYTIEIPDSAKEWIQQIIPIKTKYFFEDSRFGITVQANDGEYREAYIKIKSKKSNEHQLIKISQDGQFYTIDMAIADDPELSIFYQALLSTGLKDSLKKYRDYTYPGVSYEWTKQAVIDGDPNIHWHKVSVETDYEVMPEERMFKFTVFAVKNSVLKTDYGIESFSQLVDYAKRVYLDATSEDPTSRASAINRLISYHILPYFLTYDQFNTCNEKIINNYKPVYTEKGKSSLSRAMDSEDFFTTLLPHSIMRISTPWKSVSDTPIRLGGIFINRKGIEGVKEVELEYEGTRIAETGEYTRDNKADNGIYHYVDGLLLYDQTTKENVLNCRMRIMACTLSPDFVNSGARGRMDDANHMVYTYYPDWCENFDWVEGQTGLFVRYRNSTFGTFNGDEFSIMYDYDISLKLPPVPYSGTYELRIWNNAISGLGEGAADRGVVQFYFHEADSGDDTIYWRFWDWEIEGMPVDLRITGDDSQIGMVFDNSSEILNLPEREQQAAIDANDRAMRNRMYMKAMDSYGSLRTDKNCYRKIVWRRFMRDDQDYYLRMRQMLVGERGVMPFSFIELVPKNVYDFNEDKH